MAQAIEQLRPYIESTIADESLAFLKQWDGLLRDNWHSLRLIHLQATARVKPYEDEFNGRYSRLLDLLTHVEFAVNNFDLESGQTRQELNITSGQFRAIRLTAIDLKDTLRKIKPWAQGKGWAYPYQCCTQLPDNVGMITVDQKTVGTGVVASLGVTERLIEMWLHGLSPPTQDRYRRTTRRFLAFVNKPLHLVSLADIQGWQLTMAKLSPSSQRTALATIKSLLSFGQKIGVLENNVGLSMRSPKAKDALNERILSELEVQTMIDKETHPRNRAILLLLYSAGLRVSELCQVRWKDLQQRGSSGQVSVLGKGQKTRTVLLPASVWDEVCQLRGDAGANEPVFQSREGDDEGQYLDRTQVYRIVNTAAKRAGIIGQVSPHWLRHAHASHSLDHGAPIHLVQATLGHSSVATTSRYLHARPNDSSALYLST